MTTEGGCGPEEIKNGPEFNRDLSREPTYRDELGAYDANYCTR